MYLGIDFGTSALKASVIDDTSAEQWAHRIPFSNDDLTRPARWREALDQLLQAMPAATKRQLNAMAIDATSGTVFLCDASLAPRTPVLSYEDSRAETEVAQIAATCGGKSLVAAPTSSLAKVLWLERHVRRDDTLFIVHQADWVTALLRGELSGSDEHNALKLGFDPALDDWLKCLSILPIAARLPRVYASGAELGRIHAPLAKRHGIAAHCIIRAGTTDSMAAFIASGAMEPGDAVTSLGSTLTVKLLSPVRIDAIEHGIYSHRYGDSWLLGGASNSGGNVLASFFSPQQLISLSSSIDGSFPSALDYYPLLSPGERFPIADAHLQPRLTPRPSSDVVFLHGLLEGIARIEKLGYDRLQEMGAPAITRVFTTGGGAQNQAWTSIRRRVLEREVLSARRTEAAFGTARLAQLGTKIYKAARMEGSQAQ